MPHHAINRDIDSASWVAHIDFSLGLPQLAGKPLSTKVELPFPVSDIVAE